MSPDIATTPAHDVAEFEFTQSDAAAAARVAFDLDPEIRAIMGRKVRNKVRSGLVASFIIALAGAGLGSLYGLGRSPPSMFVGLAWGILAGLYGSIRPMFRRRAIADARESYVKLVLDRIAEAEFGRRQVSMEPDGVRESSAFWSGTIHWKGVDQIIEQPNFIFVTLRNKRVHCIPTRAFPDATGAAGFAAAGRELQHRAGETREQRAVEFASSRPIKCPQCQYDLTNTARAKCPECGRDLDIDELMAEKNAPLQQ